MTRWRAILATLPLPMLALAASYGVYEYSRPYRDWETDRKSTRLNSSH